MAAVRIVAFVWYQGRGPGRRGGRHRVRAGGGGALVGSQPSDQPADAERESGQHRRRRQRRQGHHGVAGEGTEVQVPAGRVVENRRRLGRAGGLGAGGPDPGADAARLLECHRDHPHRHRRGPGNHGDDQAPPPSGRADDREDGQDGEGLDDGRPEAGQQPEGDDRPDAVPTSGTGPPGHDDQEGTGDGVERVGGHDRTAEPGKWGAGHDQPGGHTRPPPPEIAPGHHRESGPGGRRDGRHHHQAVDRAEATDGLDQSAGFDVEPVAGRLRLTVGHVEVVDRRHVLRRVEISRSPGRGNQADHQRGGRHQPGCRVEEKPPGRALDDLAPGAAIRGWCLVSRSGRQRREHPQQ